MTTPAPMPFGRNWPVLPSGPELSVRDVGLLDLARYAARQAAMPLGAIQADTDELWAVLQIKADDLGPDLDRDAVCGVLEPFALEWARIRSEERRARDMQEPADV